MRGFMRRIRIATAAVLVQLLVGACSTVPLEGGASSDGLMASVQATTGADAVLFTLQVTNTTVEPITLTFRDGQSFDFAVMQTEEEIWRWSADQAFTQSVRQMVLPPGETIRYEATWTPVAEAAGEYVVVGSLTADRSVRQPTTFRLP